jgi:hypothetical protein
MALTATDQLSGATTCEIGSVIPDQARIIRTRWRIISIACGGQQRLDATSSVASPDETPDIRSHRG